jgi:hypothetical protein
MLDPSARMMKLIYATACLDELPTPWRSPSPAVLSLCARACWLLQVALLAALWVALQLLLEAR